ncbi:hypothetical protein P9112_000276 [Eukaryota sp. TZLM1-RC]
MPVEIENRCQLLLSPSFSPQSPPRPSRKQRKQVPRSPDSSPNPHYKTEMCRSFVELGHCEFGDQCNFAHCLNELRPKVCHAKWKTSPCVAFFKRGFCQFGSRCRFSHRMEDLVAHADDDVVESVCLLGPSGIVKLPNPRSDEEIKRLSPPTQAPGRRLSIFDHFTNGSDHSSLV